PAPANVAGGGSRRRRPADRVPEPLAVAGLFAGGTFPWHGSFVLSPYFVSGGLPGSIDSRGRATGRFGRGGNREPGPAPNCGEGAFGLAIRCGIRRRRHLFSFQCAHSCSCSGCRLASRTTGHAAGSGADDSLRMILTGPTLVPFALPESSAHIRGYCLWRREM